MTSKLATARGTGMPMPNWYSPFNNFFRSGFPDFWDGDIPDTVPGLNVYEDKDNYKVELAAPGLKKEDFKIDIDRNVVTISSEKKTETKEGEEGSNYSRREYNYSAFSRSFALPDSADTESVTAKYSDGILLLTIRKKQEDQKSRKQQIKVS